MNVEYFKKLDLLDLLTQGHPYNDINAKICITENMFPPNSPVRFSPIDFASALIFLWLSQAVGTFDIVLFDSDMLHPRKLIHFSSRILSMPSLTISALKLCFCLNWSIEGALSRSTHLVSLFLKNELSLFLSKSTFLSLSFCLLTRAISRREVV